MPVISSTNQLIWMRWKGLSETPSNRKDWLEGLAVVLFVRYPLNDKSLTQFKDAVSLSDGGRLDQIAHVPLALATTRSPTLTSPER